MKTDAAASEIWFPKGLRGTGPLGCKEAAAAGGPLGFLVISGNRR